MFCCSFRLQTCTEPPEGNASRVSISVTLPPEEYAAAKLWAPEQWVPLAAQAAARLWPRSCAGGAGAPSARTTPQVTPVRLLPEIDMPGLQPEQEESRFPLDTERWLLELLLFHTGLQYLK